MSAEQKTLLTTWLVKQRRAGVTVPVINEDVLAELDKLTPMKMSARVDAAMLALAKALPKVNQRLRFDQRERDERLIAETASEDLKISPLY